MTDVRVTLPVHLRTLARVDEEVRVQIEQAPPTIAAVLDALETRYPMLRGTIRDHGTHKRRAFIRYFAAGSDMSFEGDDAPLPASVVNGSEVFSVIGAIAGG